MPQQDAEPARKRLLREALAIRDRLLEPNDPAIAAAANDLGAALFYQSNYRESEPLYRRAIGIFALNPNYLTDRASALSNLADIMGRAAVHSGKTITWEQAMASDFRFCPNVDELTEKSPAPVQADAQGRSRRT